MDNNASNNGKDESFLERGFAKALSTADELAEITEEVFMRTAYVFRGGRNTGLLKKMQPIIDKINGEPVIGRFGRVIDDQDIEGEVQDVDDLSEKTDELRARIHQRFEDENVYHLLDSYEGHLSRLMGPLEHYSDIYSEGNIVQFIAKAKTEAKRKAGIDKQKALLLRQKILDEILPEAYAAVREAADRVFTKTREDANYCQEVFGDNKPRFGPHFDEQLMGGLALHWGCYDSKNHGTIAEMATGEGKTLAATLPAYLNALELNEKWVKLAKEKFGKNPKNWMFKPIAGVPVNKGVHIATVNDFLATRDRDWMAPVYETLGLSVGAIWDHMEEEVGQRARKESYDCDITYGTGSQFGFDYLRDNMKDSLEDQVQRGFHYAIVDEVDSILIDEAKTPMIISETVGFAREDYRVAKELARPFRGRPIEENEKDYHEDDSVDFVYNPKHESPIWTRRGIEKIYSIRAQHGDYFEHLISEAIRVRDFFELNKDYIIQEGDEHSEIVIIDQNTGRPQRGRRWRGGLHQSVEAKHEGARLKTSKKPGVQIKQEKMTKGSVTYQNFFKKYDKLSGMTGTAMTEAGEFYKIYGMDVIQIPTHEELIRIEHNDVVYFNKEQKFDAVVQEILDYHVRGQPILVGTTSVQDSELLSKMLKDSVLINQKLKEMGLNPAVSEEGLAHEVLNARKENIEREAKIVESAGELGKITVATNMAGRGTDIVLGEYEVEDLLEHWKKYGLAPEDLDRDGFEFDEKLIEFWDKKEIIDPVAAKTPLAKAEVSLSEYWRKKGMETLADIELEKSFDPFESVQELDLMIHGDTYFDGVDYPEEIKDVGYVNDLGGLHVIGTERHLSRRIDNQLRGRAGRQGDYGSSRFIISLDDELTRKFGGSALRTFLRTVTPMKDGMPYSNFILTRNIRGAQSRVEADHFDRRRYTLEYDQILDEQRKYVYGIRQKILEKADLKNFILNDLLLNCVTDKVYNAMDTNGSFKGELKEKVIREGLTKWMKQTFNIDVDPGVISSDSKKETINDLFEKVAKVYEQSKERYPEMEKVVGNIIFTYLEDQWPEHLTTMRDLRSNMGSRRYVGDPRLAYVKEGSQLFDDMMKRVREEALKSVSYNYFLAYDKRCDILNRLPV